jgi:hypothetical protein
MKVLDENELQIVNGGKADFSDVTASVSSTEQIVSVGKTSTFRAAVEAWVWGKAYSLF